MRQDVGSLEYPISKNIPTTTIPAALFWFLSVWCLCHWKVFNLYGEVTIIFADFNLLTWNLPSSETQGLSVGPGDKARHKLSSTGGKAHGYSHRTISKRSSECWLPIGHKKCFVLLCPIGEQFLLTYFREFVHDGYWLDHGLSGSCTKQMHAVRKLSVWYKL